MKKERYALRYNAPLIWLLTLPLLAVLTWNVWFSGMPLIYARNTVDLVTQRIPYGFTAQALLSDVCQHGYSKQLLSQHTRQFHESGCSPCHCAGGSCSCCVKYKVVVDPFSITEFLLAGLMTGGLLYPFVWLVNGSLTRLTLRSDLIRFPLYMASVGPPGRYLGSVTQEISTAMRWSRVFSISLVFPDASADLEEEEAFRATKITFQCSDGHVSRPTLGEFDQADLIEHQFSNRRETTLTLGKIRRSDLKLFFTGINNWADRSALAPDVLDLIERYLQLKAEDTKDFSLLKDLSFTSMWQEELGSHMAATTFVPLTKGAAIQSGRIKVIALLASGGLSAVYLAETFDRKMVILKESVVPQHVDEKTKEKARELFEREARLLLKIEHPQIARVVDHVHEAGRDYLVLEYIPGQSLRQVVKRSGQQAEATVLQWTSEIAAILGYLHGMEPPIIHRDLTPDNLVLKDDGSVALIDFGAANEYVGAATGTLIGKQAYMSPEQFRGKASPASDIYALGGTLHFLLTGQDPEALSVSHPRVRCPELSTGIDDFVAMCTEEEENCRFASISELQQKLVELTANDRGGPPSC